MSLLRRLSGRSSRAAGDPDQRARTLLSFVTARTWDDSQRIVEEHPELLRDEAEALLGQMAAAQEDADAIRVLQGHRELLRRCRVVGIPRAFNEKVLPAEALAEAAPQGLTREDVIGQVRAAQQGAPGDGEPAAPPEFADDVRDSQDALQRYLQIDDRAALDSAVAAWMRILEHPTFALAPKPFRLFALNDAGLVFLRRYEVGRRIDDLDQALALWWQGLDATPRGAPERPVRLTNYACGLYYQFARTGQRKYLDDAVRRATEAVEATPPGAPDRRGYLNNLANLLRTRFNLTGQISDLDGAIEAYRRAVEIYTRQLEEVVAAADRLGGCLSNLGLALRERFQRESELRDLDESIQRLQLSVAVTALDSPSRAGRLSELGCSLATRFRTSRQKSDLDEAIRLVEQGEAMSRGAFDHAAISNNLGSFLSERFALTKHTADLETADLEKAVDAHRQAVAETPQDSPALPRYLAALAHSLQTRCDHVGQSAARDEAIQKYRRACELGAVRDPQVVLNAARNWGWWAVARQEWAETAEAYGFGLATGRQLVARQLAREHKESWLRDLQEMAAPAAYARAKLGEVEEAAATMERGRARLLAEALERTRRDLELLPARGHEDLYRRYREIVATEERLQQPAGPAQPDALQGQARLDAIVAATRALEAVVAEIQQVTGYADFLADPTFAQLQAAAPDMSVVYLLATAAGGLALVVYAGTVQPVWLDGLTDAVVRAWLMGPADAPALGGWLGAYQDRLIARTPAAHQAWLDAVDAITQELWSALMGPLAAALHERLSPEEPIAPPVILIPAGLLALLPLHAAWTADASTPTGRRYFLDDFTVSYAPSARALRHAREGAEGAPTDRLLAVEDPRAANATPLPSVHAEVAAIAGLFDAPVILARADATRAAVRAALPQAQVVHFSCHGTNDWQNPLASGLLLADDEPGTAQWLTVQDLLDTKDAAGRLATLSACETGIVGTDVPDEVVALPSALLQVGFEGVAASLWAVPDISTAMLMGHFYRGWRADGLSPAQALRAAQRWVRDSTNREKAEYFQRYSLALPDPAKGREPDGRGFAHPVWWAAFYLTGV